MDLEKIREGSGGSPGGLEGVERTFWKDRKGRESRRYLEYLTEVREVLGGSPAGPGAVGMPSQRAGRGREALLLGRKGLGGPI